MILHKPTSPKSLLEHIFSEKASKNDLRSSYYIPRKALTILRAVLFIYSTFTFGFMLFQCRDFHQLITLPSFSLAFQLTYFGILLFQSLKGSKWLSDERKYKTISIMYELMFSFQLFNVLYYLFIILPADFEWKINPMYQLAWLNATVVNFIAIWIEQLFNMIRFYANHIYLATGGVSINIVSSYLLTVLTGGVVYIEMGISFIQASLAVVLCIAAAAVQFLIGNKYYQYKKQEKMKKRKRLNEALITFKAVKERVN